MTQQRGGTLRAAIPKAGGLAMTLAMALLAALLLAACLAEDDRANVPDISATPGTYTEVAQIITDKGCTDCHGTTASAAVACSCHSSIAPIGAAPTDIAVLDRIGMVGADTTGTTGGDLIVEANSSDTSVLYWVVTSDPRYGTNGGKMLSDMKVGGLSAADKEIIRSWIDNGALDD